MRIASAGTIVTPSDVLCRDGSPLTTLTSVAYDPSTQADFSAITRVSSDAVQTIASWSVNAAGHELSAQVTPLR